MNFKETNFRDLFLVEYFSMIDDRGFFMKPWVKSEIEKYFGDNRETYFSSSEKGTLRGLHYQEESSAQGKFVVCLKGSIEDFSTDLRKDSETYGKTFRTTIEPGKNAVIVPPGFAHGIFANEDSIIVNFCSQDYDPDSEKGILWSSVSELKGLKVKSISDKDINLPALADVL